MKMWLFNVLALAAVVISGTIGLLWELDDESLISWTLILFLLGNSLLPLFSDKPK